MWLNIALMIEKINLNIINSFTALSEILLILKLYSLKILEAYNTKKAQLHI